MLSREWEDGSKEDETIVNHFHGVWRNDFTVPVYCSWLSCVVQVGYRWYTLSNNGTSEDGRGWTGQPRNQRILFRSHIFYEVPDAFLTTLVLNWCVRRHVRANQLGRHSIQVPSPAPQEGYCLQVLDSCIRWLHASWPKSWTIHSHIQV